MKKNYYGLLLVMILVLFFFFCFSDPVVSSSTDRYPENLYLASTGESLEVIWASANTNLVVDYHWTSGSLYGVTLCQQAMIVRGGSGEVDITVHRGGSSYTETFEVKEDYYYDIKILFGASSGGGSNVTFSLDSPSASETWEINQYVSGANVGSVWAISIVENYKLNNINVNSSNPSSGVVISSSTGHGGITSYTSSNVILSKVGSYYYVRKESDASLEAPLFHGWGESRKRFTGWSGDVTSSDRSITIEIDEDKNITANYTDDPTSPLPSITGYGWLQHDQGVGLPSGPLSIEIPSGTMTSLNAHDSFFISGADFVGDEWYAVSYSDPLSTEPANIYTINTDTGILTLVGPTDVYASTGLAYNPLGKTLYLSDYADSQSNLYTVDLDTGKTTEVGKILSDIVIIGLAVDNSDNLYGISLGNSDLYLIDKDTGAGTLIGPLGVDLKFAQDVAFDRINNILYGALYFGSANQEYRGGLFLIDISSGAATFLHLLGGEVTGFAIPYCGLALYTFSDVSEDHPFFTEIEALFAAGITEGFLEDDGTRNFRPGVAFTRMAAAAFLDRAFNLEAEHPVPGTPTFTDVPLDHPFFDEIERLYAAGITAGFTEDDGSRTYRPGVAFTRMAAAAFLDRAFNLEAEHDVPGTPTFTDVPPDHPFFDEIERLYAAGITAGFTEDDGSLTYRPGVAFTRMAAAAFLYRGLGLDD